MERILLDEKQEGSSRLQIWENRLEGCRELELVINGVFIMATYNGLSSELLVRKGLAALTRQMESAAAPDNDLLVLIGGLGMGFSVREACRDPRVNQIDVVEIQRTVVEWNRKWLQEIYGSFLEDHRVNIRTADLFAWVMATESRYDLVAMDIDNGPMMLAQEDNERVYGRDFFIRVSEILNPGGVFSVWSCNPAPELLVRAGEVFAWSREETVFEEHQGRQVPYYIYLMGDSKPMIK